MSVISAADMLVLNTTFSNTNGTSPQHGVDLEPDSSTEPSNPLRLENLTFRDCRAINNSGAGFGGYLLHAWRALSDGRAVLDREVLHSSDNCSSFFMFFLIL